MLMDSFLLGGGLGALMIGQGMAALALLYLWWWRHLPHLFLWGVGFLLLDLAFPVLPPGLIHAASPLRVGLFLLLLPAGSLMMLAGAASFLRVGVPRWVWWGAAALVLPLVAASFAGISVPLPLLGVVLLGQAAVVAIQVRWYWKDGRRLCRVIAVAGLALFLFPAAIFLLHEKEPFVTIAVWVAAPAILAVGVFLSAMALEEERKRSTAILEERNRMLEEHNRELTEFLSRLSHEIKTPLTVVKGTSELIRHTLEKGIEQPERTKASLRLVEDQTRQAARVVDALVEFAAAGAMREAPVLVEASDLLARALARVEKETGRKLPISAGSLPRLFVQETCMEEIFYQLLLNAAIHGQSDEPVEVECRRTEGRFHFTVRDRGKGLPPEVVDHLFLPLVRGMGLQPPGRGMGLAKVRKLLEAQGGQAWVDKGHAPGTAIGFTLPANPGPA